MLLFWKFESCRIVQKKLKYDIYNDFHVTDLNPAAQGSSLTEGKRNRRSKKQGGENGEGGRSSSPEENNSELIVQAPEKLAGDVDVRFEFLCNTI